MGKYLEPGTQTGTVKKVPSVRFHEITSHPYVATITIDPAEYNSFERMIDEAPELKLVGKEIDRPDMWVLHIACASQRVAEGVEERWG